MIITSLNYLDLDSIDFRDYLDCDCILLTYNAMVDLHKENSFPLVFRKIVRFSSLTLALVATCFISVVDDKKYLSALIIDKGIIKGVSDMICKDPFYTDYNFTSAPAQRIYLTSKGSIGVVIDGDIKAIDCISSLVKRGANTIIFITLKDYYPEIKTYLDAQVLLNRLNIFGAFNDKWFYYKKGISLFDKGKIKENTAIILESSKEQTTKSYKKIFYEF